MVTIVHEHEGALAARIMPKASGCPAARLVMARVVATQVEVNPTLASSTRCTSRRAAATRSEHGLICSTTRRIAL